MILFFDTETTGLPLFKEPSEHPDQPHIVQISGKLFHDENLNGEWGEFDHIIKPDGWTIPDDAAKIHGITNERALADGEDAAPVLGRIFEMLVAADLVVGHNVEFDLRMMRIAAHRHQLGDPDLLKGKKTFCTMRAATSVCRLPPTEKMVAYRVSGFKAPKLSEAYEFLFNEKLEGAHSSKVDVAATVRIYLELQKRKAA